MNQAFLQAITALQRQVAAEKNTDPAEVTKVGKAGIKVTDRGDIVEVEHFGGKP